MTNKRFETLDGFLSSGDVEIAGDVEISGNTLVNTDTFFVDSTNNRVGIGKSNPSELLDINGTAIANLFSGSFSGDGSSLTNVDAETVDGIEGASLLRSNVSDVFEGSVFTFSGANVSVNAASGALNIWDNVPLRFGSTSTPSVTAKFTRIDGSTGTFSLNTSGNIDILVNNDLTVNGTVITDSLKLETELVFSLEGDATGNTTFDGSNNVNIDVSIPNASTTTRGFVSTGNQTWNGTKTADDFVAASDKNLKTDISDLNVDICLEKVLSLRPVSYCWKETDKYDTGLIAQEVQQVIEHRVHESDSETLSVSYSKLVTELIGAVQVLHQRLKELEKKE